MSVRNNLRILSECISSASINPGSEIRLRITQIHSGLGRFPRQRQTLVGLGLHAHQSSVVKRFSPEVAGMVKKVNHLVMVEAI